MYSNIKLFNIKQTVYSVLQYITNFKWWLNFVFLYYRDRGWGWGVGGRGEDVNNSLLYFYHTSISNFVNKT